MLRCRSAMKAVMTRDADTTLEPEPTPLVTVAPPLQQAVREETDRRAHTEQPRHRPERPLRRRIRRRGSSDEALLEAPRQVTLRGRKALELPADALEIRGAGRLGPLRERAHLLVEVAHLVGEAPRCRAQRLGWLRLGLGQMLRPHLPGLAVACAHLLPAAALAQHVERGPGRQLGE